MSEGKKENDVKEVFDVGAYNIAQIEESQGSDNKYYAYLALGREPDPKEAFNHWLENGGPENFEQYREHFLKKENKE